MSRHLCPLLYHISICRVGGRDVANSAEALKRESMLPFQLLIILCLWGSGEEELGVEAKELPLEVGHRVME